MKAFLIGGLSLFAFVCNALAVDLTVETQFYLRAPAQDVVFYEYLKEIRETVEEDAGVLFEFKIENKPETITGWKKQVRPKPTNLYEGDELSRRLVTIPDVNFEFTELLNVVALLLGAEIFYHKGVHIFHPDTGTFEGLEEREYSFEASPEFMKKTGKVDYSDVMVQLGMIFYEEAYAYYYPEKRLLIINNTKEQLDLIEAIY